MHSNKARSVKVPFPAVHAFPDFVPARTDNPFSSLVRSSFRKTVKIILPSPKAALIEPLFAPTIALAAERPIPYPPFLRLRSESVR